MSTTGAPGTGQSTAGGAPSAAPTAPSAAPTGQSTTDTRPKDDDGYEKCENIPTEKLAEIANQVK